MRIYTPAWEAERGAVRAKMLEAEVSTLKTIILVALLVITCLCVAVFMVNDARAGWKITALNNATDYEREQAKVKHKDRLLDEYHLLAEKQHELVQGCIRELERRMK
jgi:hypothetical protein